MNEVFWFQLHNLCIDLVEFAKFVFILGAFYSLKKLVNMVEMYEATRLADVRYHYIDKKKV